MFDWPIAIAYYIAHVVKKKSQTALLALRATYASVVYDQILLHPLAIENSRVRLLQSEWTGKGLVVVLPGFRQGTLSFWEQRNHIARCVEAEYPDVYCPIDASSYEAGKLGGDSLHLLASAHAHTISLYCKAHPDAKILFVGISYGGRLAARFEILLRREPNPVHVVTIASPMRGTELAIYLGSPYVPSYDVMDEVSPQSLLNAEFAKSLENKPAHHSYYHFYSEQDWLVHPRECALTPYHAGHCVHRTAHGMIAMSRDVRDYLCSLNLS